MFCSREELTPLVRFHAEGVVRSCRRAQAYPWRDAEWNSGESATHADVVVVVTDDDQPLPASLRAVLATWSAVPGMTTGAARLVVLFHPRAPDRAAGVPVFRELVEIAIRTGVGLVWRQLPTSRTAPVPSGPMGR